MKNLVNFKSIKAKIIFGFSIALVFVLLLAGFNFYSVNKMNNGTEEMVNIDLELLIADEKIVFHISQQLAAIRGYLLIGDEKYIEEFNQHAEEVMKNQDRILAIKDTELNNELNDRVAEWNEIIINDVFNEVKHGNRVQAIETIQETVAPISQGILADYTELATEKERFLLQQGKENIDSGNTSLYVGLGVSILVITIGVNYFCIHFNTNSESNGSNEVNCKWRFKLGTSSNKIKR